MKKEKYIVTTEKRIKNQYKELKTAFKNAVIDEKDSYLFANRNYLTPSINKKIKAGLTKKESLLLINNRLAKLQQKELEKNLTEINEIFKFESMELDKLEISVDWKKNQVWGLNPTATIECIITDTKKESRFFSASGSVSGCGYDKESSAIAVALNSEMFFKYFLISNSKKLKGIYGFSSTYFNFSGGVGTNCFMNIFRKLKFKVVEKHGKLYDVYIISK